MDFKLATVYSLAPSVSLQSRKDYGAMHLDATNFVQTPNGQQKNYLLFDMHNMAQIGLNTTERGVDLPGPLWPKILADTEN